jgi:hypothetical protein
MTVPVHSVSVYDGRVCIGNVVRRHWVNGFAVAYEALDADDRSIGIFEDQQTAATAVWRSARGQQQ